MIPDKKITFYHLIPETTIEQFKQILGKEIWEFRTRGSKNVQFVKSENGCLSCAMNHEVFMTLKSDNKLSTWGIKSIPLGDTQVGYDMYFLEFQLKHPESDYDAWYKWMFNSDAEPNHNVEFRCGGIIKTIEIFGYYAKTVRDDDMESTKLSYEIEADIDMLVVFNTYSNDKIALSGHSSIGGAIITIYPENATASFQDWRSYKKNQWEENLLDFRMKIE
jgi:hypothetical protein